MSVWPYAVARAEMHPSHWRLHEYPGLRDDACGLGYPNRGRRLLLDPLATLHGCTVGDNCLIGVGATVMDGAMIGENSIVGEHALVRPG